jgi:hypothetical protein
MYQEKAAQQSLRGAAGLWPGHGRRSQSRCGNPQTSYHNLFLPFESLFAGGALQARPVKDANLFPLDFNDARFF